MTIFEAICISLAGIAAGTINTVVGSGALVTFPTLLAFGYSPVMATMSNAVGLVPGNISGTLGLPTGTTRPVGSLALRTARFAARRVDRGVAVATPTGNNLQEDRPGAAVFALVLVIAQPRIQAWTRRRAEEAGHTHDHITRTRMVLLVISTYLTGVYGG